MSDDKKSGEAEQGLREKLDQVDLEKTRHLRVSASLNGYGTLTLEQTYKALVAELRSDGPISRDLRDAIADALECGQINGDGVRLKIEAPGRYFKMVQTEASEFRLIEAGRYIAIEEQKARTFGSIYLDLAEKYKISDTQDFGRRARKIFAEFIGFCKRNMDDIAVWSGSLNFEIEPGQNHPVGFDESLILHDEDVFYYARSAFIESRNPSND